MENNNEKPKKSKTKVLLTAIIILAALATLSFIISLTYTKKQTPKSKWDQYALLLIGCQNDFWTEDLIKSFPNFARNIHNLLSLCREEGIEIIYLRAQIDPDVKQWPPFNKLNGRMPCVKGTGGDEILDFAKEQPGELVIFKKSFDGFMNPTLDRYLKKHNKKHLLVAGMCSSFCILCNSFSAFQRGYVLSLVEDCVADDSKLAHKYVTQRYNNFLFKCISLNDIKSSYPKWQQQLKMLEEIDKLGYNPYLNSKNVQQPNDLLQQCIMNDPNNKP